jgi:hypothetical protein
MNISTPKHWQILFGLWTLQGIAVFYWLIAIPTDTENPFAFGFSAARVVLIGVDVTLVLVSLLCGFRVVRSSSKPGWIQRNISWSGI